MSEESKVKKYLSIVTYMGGQVDNSLKSTIVMTSDQFLYGYEEEDKGFSFTEVEIDYGDNFTAENLRDTLKVKTDDEVLNALYGLSDFGYRTGDGDSDPYQFLRHLTGAAVKQVNSVDPRAMS